MFSDMDDIDRQIRRESIRDFFWLIFWAAVIIGGLYGTVFVISGVGN